MQYYTQRLVCSHDEKFCCLKTVKKLFAFALLARKNSVLAIEDAVEDEPDLFLKTAVGSLFDIVDHELAETCLYAYLMAGDYHGEEYLKNILIVNGLLQLLKDTNPITLIKVLKGWFGVEFAQTYQREMDAEFERLRPTPPKLPAAQSMVADFDKLTELTDEQVAQLFATVDISDLAMALKGASDRVSNFLFNKFPENQRERLHYEASLILHPRVIDVEVSQRNILETIGR